MPMIRYEIRNEYTLADPELYRAADKDDPEALLEGVAMAGLVGVLRQLGDLAEFAAEIFHNLHEEVMATAARGHSLMARIQQLETEVPSIERAFLSQTDHSSLFYNDGIDWRSNLRIDENLVTQGDLPRFIRDSYEDCRPPPRLFLLDKFDVAGAGACLKRYTDPSFFKVETSRMTSSDIQREKKILKPKRKGSRWRNADTPEIAPTSHTKLHQLLSEERSEFSVSNPSRRVKLKRKLNGFPFDSKTGKSYMEKLLKSSSPDHELLHEVYENILPPPVLTRSDQNESRLEVLDVRPLGTDTESVKGKRSPPSPDREEIVLNPSMHNLPKVPLDDNGSTVPNTYHGVIERGISSSTLDQVTSEKVIAVDAESHRECGLTGYESDGMSSDVENFVDAPLTMESDTDTESRVRMKTDFASPLIKSQQPITDANKEHINHRSLDSRSTGDSLISDERKEISSFSSSGSPSTSAEIPHLQKSANGFPSADNPEIERHSASSFPNSADKVFPVDRDSQPVVSYSTYTRTNSINSRTSDEQPISRMCRNESISSSSHSEPGVVTKYMLRHPGSDETASNLDDHEKEANLVINTPCHPSVSDSEVPHGDESDHKDGNLLENRAYRLKKFNARSRRTIGIRQLGSSKNLIPGKSDDEVPKLLEDLPSGYPDTAHQRNSIVTVVPQEENIIYQLDNEDSDIAVNVSDNSSGMTVASLGKKLNETTSPCAQIADALGYSTENRICSENLELSRLAKSPDCLQPDVDAGEEDIIPEQQTAVHENLALGPSKSCEVVGLHGTGITDHVSPGDIESLQSSDHVLEKVEEPAGKSDPIEVDGIMLTSSVGQEVTALCDSADQKSLNEVHVDFEDSEGDKSGAVEEASTELAISENAVLGNIHLNVGLEELVEEHNRCLEYSGLGELDNNNNCLTGVHGKDGPVDEVVKTNAAATDVERVSRDSINNDHPKSGVSDEIPDSHLDSKIDNGLESDPATTEMLLGGDQSRIDSEIVLSERSDVGNHVSDAASLAVNHDAEESKAQEKIGLPLNQLDQELPYAGEILDHEDRKGANDSAFTSSLVDNLDQSFSKPQSNYDIDVSGYAMDPLHPNFNPCSLLSDTNLINLADPPPLPPLPPMQWRMGKLQRASSYNEVEMKKLELLPQFVSPLSTSTDCGSSTLGMTSSNDLIPSPLIAPVNDAGSSMEEMQHSLVQTATKTVSEKEGVEDCCSDLESNDNHDRVGLPLNMKINPQQPVLPIHENESVPPVEEDGTERRSCTEELPHPHPPVEDVAALHNSQLGEVTEQVKPQLQEVDGRDSLLEQAIPQGVHERVDLPPKKENKQQQFIMPTLESESLSPAEDGVAHGSHTGKLPQPGATLLEVASLDMSQQKDVSEHGLPQIQKVDERDSLSEQIRTEDMNEASDHQPELNSMQQQLVMPTPKSDSMPPAEDGVARESHAEKLSGPCNALVKDAADIDGNLPREVAEQVKPQPQKGDENLLSEQMTTKDLHKTTDLPPKMEGKQQQVVMQTSVNEVTSQSEENEAAHGSHTLKKPLPHNPLVEDKSVLDQCKLRKVTERVIPQIPKLDDRNSFLEQIRNRSSTLKHTTSSLRPSVPGRAPATNLKVAAILEKANAIRQAMAGSDEDDDDDDDSWSDS